MRWVVRDCLLLLLGAFFYTIASPPYEWSGAAWLTLAPLFLVIHTRTPWGAGIAGFCYGVLACAGVASWVYDAISSYFSFPSAVDFFLTFVSYSFFVGCYTGLAAALSCRVIQRSRWWVCCLAVPALWVSGEFARSSLFAGFSWWLLGYTQSHNLMLIQVSDLTGVYGISFLLALSGYVTAELWRSVQRQEVQSSRSEVQRVRFLIRNSQFSIGSPGLALCFLTVVIALTLLYGQVRLLQYTAPTSTQPVRVAVVQAQVDSAQRWQPAHYARTLRSYMSLTQQSVARSAVDLVVWPEFAVGFYLDREPLLRAQLGRLVQYLGAPLVLGAPRMEQVATGTHYYNSAYFLTADSQPAAVYDKRRLLPFAEYRSLDLPLSLSHNPYYPSEFTAGTHSTIFPLPQGAFGVLICYEATYPDLSRHLVRGGARFFVNVSNDTWLGGRVAAVQHFAMTVFRAVEYKRPLVRVATAGVSGFVDPFGRSRQLSHAEETVILGDVFPRQELTVYARWGDWFAWGCVGFACVTLISSTTRRTGGQGRL